jgi:hypothetical protein
MMEDEPVTWEEVMPPVVLAWFRLFALANLTSTKIMFAAMLASVSCLIRHAKIKFFDDWEEKGNLLMISIGGSGCGKTPACMVGCCNPLYNKVEPADDGHTILVDDFTNHGIFRMLYEGDNFFSFIVLGMKNGLDKLLLHRHI